MNADATNQRLKRRRGAFMLALVALLVLVGLFSFWGLLPSHPHFGAIYETAAFDANETLYDPVGEFLRKHLPRRVVQSRHFPSTHKDKPRFLDLKGARLEWSIAGTDTGWLYFRDVRQGTLRWEFAPCSETNLLGVRVSPAEFYGASDSRLVEAFGDKSSTNAIKVAVGQILFARETDQKDTIYVLKLREQHGNKLVVDYCVTSRRTSRGR